jgi:hypothetical protein
MAVGRIDPLALREQLPVPATVALSLSFLLFPFFLFFLRLLFLLLFFVYFFCFHHHMMRSGALFWLSAKHRGTYSRNPKAIAQSTRAYSIE